MEPSGIPWLKEPATDHVSGLCEHGSMGHKTSVVINENESESKIPKSAKKKRISKISAYKKHVSTPNRSILKKDDIINNENVKNGLSKYADKKHLVNKRTISDTSRIENGSKSPTFNSEQKKYAGTFARSRSPDIYKPPKLYMIYDDKQVNVNNRLSKTHTKLSNKENGTTNSNANRTILGTLSEVNSATPNRYRTPKNKTTIITSTFSHSTSPSDSFGFRQSPPLSPMINREVLTPNISGLFSVGKRVTHKKDIIDIMNAYKEQLSKYYDSIQKTISERVQIIRNTIDFSYMCWNRVIIDIRAFSEEHSRVLYEVKNFFKSALEDIPCIKIEHDEELSRKNEEISRLNMKISEMEGIDNAKQREIDEMKNEISQLIEALEQVENEKYAIETMVEKTQYSNDELKNKVDTLSFDLLKAEKEIQRMKEECESKSISIEKIVNQIDEYEDRIKEYQEHDAGYMPAYMECRTMNVRLESRIEDLEQQIDSLSKKPSFKDSCSQPDVGFFEQLSNEILKSRKKTRRKSSRAKETNFRLIDSPSKNVHSAGNLHKALPYKKLKKKSKSAVNSPNQLESDSNCLEYSLVSGINATLSTLDEMAPEDEKIYFKSTPMRKPSYTKLDMNSSMSNVIFNSHVASGNCMSPDSASTIVSRSTKFSNTQESDKKTTKSTPNVNNNSPDKTYLNEVHVISFCNDSSREESESRISSVVDETQMQRSKESVHISNVEELPPLEDVLNGDTVAENEGCISQSAISMEESEDFNNGSSETSRKKRNPSVGLSSLRTTTDMENDKQMEALPSDYSISSDHLANADLLVTMMYKLLPLPLVHSLDSSPTNAINNILVNYSSDAPKKYSWLLTHLVNLFTAFAGVDVDMPHKHNVIEISKMQLLRITGMQGVTDQIFKDLVIASNYFKCESKTAQAFLSFMLQEYTTIDFVFSNVLFNVAFDAMYPHISTLLQNQDLTADEPQFLIHLDICTNISKILFPHMKKPFDKEELVSKSGSKWPELVSFWDFMIQSVIAFRNTHEQFHRQVKTLLFLSGWRPGLNFGHDMFLTFIYLIKPRETEDKVERLYNRLCLEIEQGCNKEVNHMTIIKFCSDFPEVINDILKLPYLPTFESDTSELQSPMIRLILFSRNRYTGFIRKLMKTLPVDLYEKCFDIYVKIRNAILLCDISNVMTLYTYMLQIIDLKLTEIRPYIVTNDKITEEESRSLINMVKSREQLAANLINELSAYPHEEE